MAVISGTMGSGQDVRFAGSGAVLGLDNLPAFAAAISGFASGDRIELGGFSFSNGPTRSFTEAATKTSGTLTVTDHGQTARLTLLGDYATSNFTLANDGKGGTFVGLT